RDAAAVPRPDAVRHDPVVEHARLSRPRRHREAVTATGGTVPPGHTDIRAGIDTPPDPGHTDELQDRRPGQSDLPVHRDDTARRPALWSGQAARVHAWVPCKAVVPAAQRNAGVPVRVAVSGSCIPGLKPSLEAKIAPFFPTFFFSVQ